jgi:hypothetical protein
MLRLRKALKAALEMPAEFTKNRYSRRFNMQDEDRIKFFNWNVATLLVTILPLAYIQTVSYHSSDDTDQIMRALDPTREAKITNSPDLWN